MAKRSEYLLAMAFGSTIAAILSFFGFRRSPAPLNLDVLDKVSTGAQVRMVFRRDANRATFIALSQADRAIVALDVHSREKLEALLRSRHSGRKWFCRRSPAFTMWALPRFSKAELQRRALLVAGLKKIEVLIEPQGRFGGDLRLVVSH